MPLKPKMIGAAKARAEFNEAKTRTELRVQNILVKYGFDVETLAKRTASQKHIKKSGRLIGSISTNWTGSGMLTSNRVKPPAGGADGVSQPPPSGKRFTVHVGSGVEYAIYHEFGTKKMKARPFLFPAYYEIEPKIIDATGGVLKNITKK